MHYRPEIDGLRALAVVPVILFHGGFQAFGGGFVGVDIFFVISGYLITSIILAEMEEGKFSLVRFYERRARRILPALFLVMAVCIPFAWLWLLPQDMKDFSQSQVAVSTFSSNILFWSESGYFDTAAELKPLLHTWSLAVEEQYYILFPLFLMFAWKLGKRWILASLALIGMISLGVAQWAAHNDPTSAFYLLPTRGWEILLGALVAFHLGRRDASSFSAQVNQCLSVLGAALILYAIFAFDQETPFPGFYALVPTLGAVLIILFAQQGTLVNSALSVRGVVGIGLISYSAYLWHQPLLAFARHRSVEEPSTQVVTLLCAATLLLAYLSWKYVETPFRSKSRIPRTAVFRGATLGGLTFIAFGVLGHTTDGLETQWLARQSDEVARTYSLLKGIDEKAASEDASKDNGDCRFNARNITPVESERLLSCHSRYGKGVAILGDSHAIDLYGVVTTANPAAPFVVGVTQGFCRVHTPAPGCQYEGFLAFVEEHGEIFSGVIYEQAAFYLLRKENEGGSRKLFSTIPMSGRVDDIYPDEALIKSVHDYLEKVSRHTPVLWFGSRVEPHIDRKQIMRLGCSHEYQIRENQYEVFRALDRVVADTVGDTRNLSFLSQNDVFDYSFPRDFMTCDALYWADGDHLSTTGEEYFGRRHSLLEHFNR